MSTRIDRDTMFMEIAQIVAQRGTCPRKQVGAVMVRENRIVSIGYNGAPPGMPHCPGKDGDVASWRGCGGEGDHQGGIWFTRGCTRAIHAEMNAVAFAARQGARTDDAAMYSTCATCATCAALLVSCGIARFVYLEPYRLTEGLNLLNDAGVEVMQHGATR